jgi:hypothetical protein
MFAKAMDHFFKTVLSFINMEKFYEIALDLINNVLLIYTLVKTKLNIIICFYIYISYICILYILCHDKAYKLNIIFCRICWL